MCKKMYKLGRGENCRSKAVGSQKQSLRHIYVVSEIVVFARRSSSLNGLTRTHIGCICLLHAQCFWKLNAS